MKRTRPIFTEIPKEVHFIIGLELDYMSVIALSITLKKTFNDEFWKMKIKRDFNINVDFNSTKEKYIELAGNRNIIIPGIERHVPSEEKFYVSK